MIIHAHLQDITKKNGRKNISKYKTNATITIYFLYLSAVINHLPDRITCPEEKWLRENLLLQYCVDIVLQGYIIDGTYYKIYSVKMYIRYLKSLLYILSAIISILPKQEIGTVGLSIAKVEESVPYLRPHCYFAKVFPANSWRK